jgi:predicted transcriptional regulator
MTSPAWHAKARRLRAEGYSYDAIAILLEKSRSGVWRVLNRDRAAATWAKWDAKPENRAARMARAKKRREEDPTVRERDARSARYRRIKRKLADRHVGVPVLPSSRAWRL